MSLPEETNPPKEGREPCATRSEKAGALNALKTDDYGRLFKFAEFTAMKFSGRVKDSNAEDLLHEAIVRVLDERNIRKWYPRKVEFLTFLRGCIRSIANEWYQHARDTELPDELLSPIRHDAQAEASMMIEKIREKLKGRPHAVEIFDLKCEGRTAKEIQKHLGINEQVYAAAVKWIERGLRQRGFRR
jgi:RNA polymerase sigma factor (sigma-70 family)